MTGNCLQWVPLWDVLGGFGYSWMILSVIKKSTEHLIVKKSRMRNESGQERPVKGWVGPKN